MSFTKFTCFLCGIIVIIVLAYLLFMPFLLIRWFPESKIRDLDVVAIYSTLITIILAVFAFYIAIQWITIGENIKESQKKIKKQEEDFATFEKQSREQQRAGQEEIENRRIEIKRQSTHVNELTKLTTELAQVLRTVL